MPEAELENAPVAESPAQEANPGEPARAAAAKEEPEGEDTITFGSTGPEAYSSYEERVTVNMDMSMKLTRGDAVLQKGKVTTQTPQISPYLFWYEAPHPVRFAQLAFG